MSDRAIDADLPAEMMPQAAPGTWECALSAMPRSGRVLCAGAGRGGLSYLLDKRGYEVTNIDLHPEHFAAPGLVCKFADLHSPLAEADEAFDVVLAVEVVEHLENPWFFLREAIRVLRPYGTLVFTSPNVESLAARIAFLGRGELPYFRDESFFGCYHVTPIFVWAVRRWCTTTTAELRTVTYSRANWPTRHDVPQYDRGISRLVKSRMPVTRLTGEIACYAVEKTGQRTLEVGHHYR